jgi:catalase
MAALYNHKVAPHSSELVSRPTQYGNDAAFAGWTNNAAQVWATRNNAEDWERLAVYPAQKTSFLAPLELRRQILLLSAMFMAAGLKSRRRGTHPCGVAAKGTAVVVDNPNIPDHPFFTPGRKFDLRLRHANGSFFDDAACTIRGCSIKFADSDYESPFDLMMNSGSQGPLWSVESFLTFAWARLGCNPATGDFEAQAKLMDKNPAFLVSWIESVRDAPSSYSDVTYFGRMVFPFVGSDNVLRYCRFRLRRPDLEKESGLADELRQNHVWNIKRNPDNDLPLDYMRREFEQRVVSGKLEYVLQIQVRDTKPDDSNAVFHLNQTWNDQPWTDLARLNLDEMLSQETAEKMRFSLSNMPDGLGVFSAPSVTDYRSIGMARLAIYPVSSFARRSKKPLPPVTKAEAYS